ncbi:hypothetical protein ACJX0J_039168 [Zea mays]
MLHGGQYIELNLFAGFNKSEAESLLDANVYPCFVETDLAVKHHVLAALQNLMRIAVALLKKRNEMSHAGVGLQDLRVHTKTGDVIPDVISNHHWLAYWKPRAPNT